MCNSLDDGFVSTILSFSSILSVDKQDGICICDMVFTKWGLKYHSDLQHIKRCSEKVEDIYKMTMNTRFISLPAQSTVVYANSDIGLAYPTAVYTYITPRIPNGCAPKIYFTASVINGYVHTLLAYTPIL